MEPDSEAIICDNSVRFSVITVIRMMTRIMQRVFARGLPTNREIRRLESSNDNRGLEG